MFERAKLLLIGMKTGSLTQQEFYLVLPCVFVTYSMESKKCICVVSLYNDFSETIFGCL